MEVNDKLLIELEIIFSIIKHRKFYNKVSFLNKEDFEYFGNAYDYITKNNALPEVVLLKDLVEQGLIKKEFVDLYDELVPSEGDLNLTQKYASWIKEKSVLKKIVPKVKAISSKTFTSVDQIYFELRNIQEDIAKSHITKTDVLTLDDLAEIFFAEIDKTDVYRFGFRFDGEDLDGYIYDFVPGNVVVIGARPGIGKTLLSLHVAYKLALEDIPVHMISMEMTKFQIFSRLATMLTSIPSYKIFKKELTNDEKQVIKETISQIQSWPLYFTSTHDGTLDFIESLIRRSAYENGTKVFIIDYLQLMSNPQFSGNRHLEIGSIAQRLKTLAIELDVTIVEISQLSRRLNEEPNIDDLKESGDIEQAASLIVLMWNKKEEELEKITDSNGNIKSVTTRKYVNFKVGKQRNGPLFKAIVSYDTKTFNFRVEEITFGQDESKRKRQ